LPWSCWNILFPGKGQRYKKYKNIHRRYPSGKIFWEIKKGREGRQIINNYRRNNDKDVIRQQLEEMEYDIGENIIEREELDLEYESWYFGMAPNYLNRGWDDDQIDDDWKDEPLFYRRDHDDPRTEGEAYFDMFPDDTWEV